MGQNTSYAKFSDVPPNPQNNPKQPAPQQPALNQPRNPILNPYAYQENLGANYFNRNPSNEKNRIYIARNCFGAYITKEFTPALTFNRIPQKEFDQEIEKINTVVSSFRYIKCLYILMVLLMLASVIILIVGLSLNPDLTIGNDAMKYVAEYFQSQNIAYNVLTGLGLMFLLLSGVVFTMAVICTLKKYEFLLAKHFNKINRDSYLTRNVYWKIGGFCRFIELNILPIQPEFFWFLQTHGGQEVEINNIKEILNI